jgi:hypothetical protein
MSFDFKLDLVFERLDSGVFEREETVSDQTSELDWMFMPFLLWESELSARGVFSDFYPSDDRIACFPFVEPSRAHSVQYWPDFRCWPPRGLTDVSSASSIYNPTFPETKISLLAVHRLPDDHIVKHLDLQNSGGFVESPCQAKISFARAWVAGRVIVRQDERVSRMNDNWTKDIPRIRTVDAGLHE